MTVEKEFDADGAQRLLVAWTALRDGRLNIAPQFRKQAEELKAAPLTMAGLVDTSGLSESTISFGRMAGTAMRVIKHEQAASVSASLPMVEAQQELFRLFKQLFSALTGVAVELVAGESEIRDRMLWRTRHEAEAMDVAVNAAGDELAAFYKAHSIATFRHAKTFGGMRLVTGGQRAFGPSACTAVRITGLYADTQLIPDPVYPFFASDLRLNAKLLQLAHALFYVLQLRPLVDAELPVPPIFVFPSFEESLEEGDAHTMHEMEKMAIRMLGPLCDGSVTSLNELFEYARRHGEGFARAILSAGLFVPPGGQVGRQLDVAEAVHDYIAAVEGVRSEAVVNGMKKLPPGVLILNGVLERLRPYYHLLENANELGAQPLLSQPVQWHYFEKCARANAQDLLHKSILSEQAFQTLHAIQDDSLSWLANISVQNLSELIINNEHRYFREELNKYTVQLANSGAANVNDMVREVNHGLASLVQRQQKAMNDIERKYAPKKMAAYIGGGASLSLAAAAAILPNLSPLLGVAVPTAAALAAVGGGAIGFGKEKIGEYVEKRQVERSILGVLATARPRP